MKKGMVLGIVAVLIIAAFAYVAMQPSGSGSETDTNMTATVYVQNTETGETVSGDISMNEPSWDEAAMLSLGQSIRVAELTSYGITDPIESLASYLIWVNVTVEAEWSGITITENSVKFTANAQNNALYYSKSASASVVTINDEIQNGGRSYISMSDASCAWKHYIKNPASSQATYADITGNMLDGMVLKAVTKISGTDQKGATLTQTDTAEITLSVNNEGQEDASISVSITDIGSSTQNGSSNPTTSIVGVNDISMIYGGTKVKSCEI